MNRQFIIVASILYILIVLWGLNSEGTWDDDCPTRYYQVKHAIENPREFISVWNRPLFTLLYFLPLQLGKSTVVFQTGLIAVLAGYFLALAASELKMRNAWLVLPFVVLQAFYFPVAFNALAEPLAALCISLGIYFYVKKNWLGFVITGSFLPLARLEMSPLLLLWAFGLFEEGQWKFIPMLGIPTILWSLTGTAFDGNWLWLVNQVFTGQENRYGHGAVLDYPVRYIYVLGPVIFYFFMLGLFERVYQRKADFVLSQFVLGFFVYIFLATWSDIGHSAGFLRNLLPLSPLAALLALEGFNLWHEHKKQDVGRVLIYSGIIMLLAFFFFSYKLVQHHFISTEPEYTKLAIIVLLVALFLFRKNLLHKVKDIAFTVLIVVTTLLYTLITEPAIKLTPEREAMKSVAGWFKENKQMFANSRILVNHIWFFYAGDFDYFGDEKYGRVKVSELEAAKSGTIVVWDTHYGHRLNGDVQPEYLRDNKSFKQIGGLQTTDGKFAVFVFKKK